MPGFLCAQRRPERNGRGKHVPVWWDVRPGREAARDPGEGLALAGWPAAPRPDPGPTGAPVLTHRRAWPSVTDYVASPGGWDKERPSEQPPAPAASARLPPALPPLKNGLLNSGRCVRLTHGRAANVYAEKIHFSCFVSNGEQMLFP